MVLENNTTDSQGLKFPIEDVHIQMSSIDIFKDLIMDNLLLCSSNDSIKLHLSKEIYLHLFKSQDFSKLLPFCYHTSGTKLSIHNDIIRVTEDNAKLSTYQNDMRLFLNSYYHLNKKVYNENSLADLTIDYIAQEGVENSISFNKWYISVDEYQNRLELVEKAFNLYNEIPNYTYLENKKLILNAQVDIDLSIKFLVSVTNQLKVSKKIIENELVLLSKNWRNDAVSNYNMVYEKYFVLNNSFQNFLNKFGNTAVKKPNLLSFSKEEKLKFESFKTLIDSTIELKNLFNIIYPKSSFTEDFSSLITVENFLTQVNITLSAWTNEMEKELSEKISRVSKLNTNNENLLKAAIDIEEILAKLNDKSLFNYRIELNSNVFGNYIDFSIELIKQCNQIISELNEQDAVKSWDAFLSSLPKKDLEFILKFVKSNSTNWLEDFKTYHYGKLLISLRHPQLVSSQKRTKDLYQNFILMSEIKSNRTLAHISRVYKNRFDELQKNEPKFLKPFLKEKKDIIKLDYYKEDIQKLAALFPITIKEIADENVNAYIQISGSIEKFFYFSISVDDALENIKFINSPMVEIPMTERYFTANSIATSLLEYIDEFSIIQMKNANMVCLWPNKLTSILLNKLDGFGAKQFKTKYREKDALVESIIETSRKQILIMIDGLPNARYPEEVINQSKVVEAFEVVGFQIYNIWTCDLLDNAELVFEDLLQKIQSI